MGRGSDAQVFVTRKPRHGECRIIERTVTQQQRSDAAQSVRAVDVVRLSRLNAVDQERGGGGSATDHIGEVELDEIGGVDFVVSRAGDTEAGLIPAGVAAEKCLGLPGIRETVRGDRNAVNSVSLGGPQEAGRRREVPRSSYRQTSPGASRKG